VGNWTMPKSANKVTMSNTLARSDFLAATADIGEERAYKKRVTTFLLF